MSIDILRSALVFDETLIHLNNAGVSCMLQPAVDAMQEAAMLHANSGFHAIAELIAQYGKARESHARLLGTTAESVSFMQTCAAAISQVALGMELNKGEEIVIWDQEYGSNAYPWHEAAKRSGAEVTVVKSNTDFSIDSEEFAARISEKTAVVSVSWVQFQTGAVADLKLISKACRKYGAWLVVDVIQGLGVIPFSMHDYDVDAVCGGSHKWLMGPLGHGFLALKPGRAKELSPLLHGAFTYGAPGEDVEPDRLPKETPDRFEPGAPLLLGALGTAASIELLCDIGIEKINKEALRLAEILREGLQERGAELLRPKVLSERSPITTFRPRQDLAAVSESLREHKISYARRAGGVRLAPHAFNSEADIEAVFSAVESA